MIVHGFLIMGMPLLITTFLLAGQARWAWGRTMDKILRGMNLDKVQKRVEQSKRHRLFAKRHATAVATLFMFGLIMSYMLPYSDWADMPSMVVLWTYVLLVPHLLALYLYHVRWNPRTLERKHKLDAEDVIYEGDFSLKADVQYGISDEGELIELAASEATERLQEQA